MDGLNWQETFILKPITEQLPEELPPYVAEHGAHNQGVSKEMATRRIAGQKC